MDELIALVSQKTGIPEEVAKTAVETVTGYLKEKLPGPIAAQIDTVLESPDIAKKAGDVLGGLGGILGSR